MTVETECVEYKESTTELEDAVLALSAMLNKNGYGKVIFGAKNDGTLVGQDIGKDTLKTISQHIQNFVEPRVIPTIEVTELEKGKGAITVAVSGLNRPYAYKNNIYIRSGEENKKVPITELRQMFQSYSDLLKDTVAFRQDLTFNGLVGRLRAKGLHVNDDRKLYDNYELMRIDGKFNIQAELLSDQNKVPLTAVVFDGTDRTAISIRKDFSGRNLFDELEQVQMFAESMNENRVVMEGLVRKETQQFEMDAFREAWVNACAHNTWTLGIPPTVQFFSDRVEIISNGSIPYIQTTEEFFNGRSMPINESLMRIFIAAGISEHTGHGVPVIVREYGREAFEITGGTVKVTLRYRFERNGSMVQHSLKDKNPETAKILQYLSINPECTLSELSEIVGIKRGTLGKIIIKLQQEGVLAREGSKRSGSWKVMQNNNASEPKNGDA
ncbi:ATP-dependent DNA helicase [methanogenic archaeon ISO4-H5]|nr:ATP-dependent DNA helicase [methanogenic archaeon ISO4-H5]MBP5734718.1 putative DNA binding domain-containing protein [Candidatus Methanomethylophilaceae archaeon]